MATPTSTAVLLLKQSTLPEHETLSISLHCCSYLLIFASVFVVFQATLRTEGSTSTMTSPQRPHTPADVKKAETDTKRQELMIDARKVGDMLRLLQLFEATGVRKSNLPVKPQWISYPDKVEHVPASGPATTSSMVWTAVKLQTIRNPRTPAGHIFQSLHPAFAQPHPWRRPVNTIFSVE